MSLLPGAEPFYAAGGPVGVLLCHGFTGSPQSVRPWGEYLARHGLTVAVPRLPGHGTQWEQLALTRWPDWYAAVNRAYDDLRRQCDTVFVMGLSMGGTLALRLAEEHGTAVRGLVLVNPSLLSTRLTLRLLPLLRWAVPTVAGVAGDVKKPGVAEVGYDRVPLHALASLVRLWKLTRRDLGRVVCPVLLFRSVEDRVVEPANGAALLTALRCEDVEERLCLDSGHVATLDNDAPAIFAASLDFVRRLTACGPGGPGGRSGTVPGGSASDGSTPGSALSSADPTSSGGG